MGCFNPCLYNCKDKDYITSNNVVLAFPLFNASTLKSTLKTFFVTSKILLLLLEMPLSLSFNNTTVPSNRSTCTVLFNNLCVKKVILLPLSGSCHFCIVITWLARLPF